MLPFTDAPDTYWRLSFPAFVIGTIGCVIVFSNSKYVLSLFSVHRPSPDLPVFSIAIFAYTPSSAAGTVGAIFNSALQLGSSVGIAAVTSIQTSIDGDGVRADSARVPTTKAEWTDAYRGRAAAYWFVFTAVVLEMLAVLVFFRSYAIPSDEKRGEDRERKQDEKALNDSTQQSTRV